jgi:hypothetical protein
MNNKQRFLAGDTFQIAGAPYKYDKAVACVGKRHRGVWINFGSVTVETETYAKVTGWFFDMRVTYAIEFANLKFPKP